MTLIAGAHDGTDCVLVSDILLSSPLRPSAPPILPMGIGRPLAPSSPGEPRYHVHGTCRKVTLVSPTLAVAWAGRSVVGISITKRLIEMFSGRKYIPTSIVADAIRKMASELSPKFFDELGIMALNLEQVAPGKFHIYIWGGGCTQMGKYLDAEIMITGSGEGHFISDLYEIMGSVDPINKSQLSFKQALIACLHYIQSKQLDVGDAYEHHYGGWFELIVPGYLDGEMHLTPLSNVAVIDMVPVEVDGGIFMDIFASYFQTYIDDVLVILCSEKSNTGFGMTDVHCIPPCIDPQRDVADKIMSIDLKSDAMVFYLTLPYKKYLKKMIIPVFGNEKSFIQWTPTRISLTVDEETKKAVEGALEMMQSS